MWRYLRNMKHFRFFLLTSVVAGGAWAQPAVSRENVTGQNAPEQRRAELRSALRATRGDEGQDQALEKAYLTRQLSQQEKADLRQQLRQQRRDARLDTP
jgi:uncharacterized membrane protein